MPKKHGWVSMDASGKIDWEDVRAMIHESYSLIAPKKKQKAKAKKPKPARGRAPTT